MRKLTHAELLARQAGLDRAPLPFCAVLNNIRSLYNVGSIFRTADGAGLSKLWLCGITGIPPDSMISKTALGAEESVAWEYREDAAALIQDLKREGWQIVFLEQVKGGVPHDAFLPSGPVCLVLGNEVEGVAGDLLKLADAAIEIEMAGLKNSLNVAVAFGVVAYQVRTRLKAGKTGAASCGG